MRNLVPNAGLLGGKPEARRSLLSVEGDSLLRSSLGVQSSEIRHMAVLVPARNEESLICRCLESIQKTRTQIPSNVTTDVIVVSDGSTDRTVEFANEVLHQSGAVVRTDAQRVGTARALAAEVALKRYGGPANTCWFANTDADCVVPMNWLPDQLAIAQSGVAAVAGIVDVDSFEEHSAPVRELFRLTYLLGSDGSHPHVHGANLGMRADAYLLAGGWPALAHAEDHDLWRRLQSSRLPCLSVTSLTVLTSGRRVGRAPHGFADALAAHNERSA